MSKSRTLIPRVLWHFARDWRAAAERVKMLPGYYVEWGGQYENQIRAKERLQIVVPAVPFAWNLCMLHRNARPSSDAVTDWNATLKQQWNL